MIKLLKWAAYGIGGILVFFGFYVMTEWTIGGDSIYAEPTPYRTSIGWLLVLGGFLNALIFAAVARIYEATVKQ